MVNPKSELFEHHPDWVVRQPKRELDLQRNQLVLDLTRPEVQAFEWQSIQNILGVPGHQLCEMGLQSLPLTQPGSSSLAADRQSHLWVDYVTALYALMDKNSEEISRHGINAVFRRRRARGLRRTEIFSRILAERQHRSDAARPDAMGLFVNFFSRQWPSPAT